MDIILHPSHHPFKGITKVQEVEDRIGNQKEVLKLLKAKLIMEKNGMTQEAHQYDREREFEVGDWVFLRIQPYKQMSLKQQKKENKLAPKHYGSYKVLQRIGSMAYKLELPPSSCVHPVFHVSFLKKVIGNNIPVQKTLPELNEEGKIILEPETILETRIKQLKNRAIVEYLVKWKNLLVEEATWEDDLFMQKHLWLDKC
jgi:hypothetical protein